MAQTPRAAAALTAILSVMVIVIATRCALMARDNAPIMARMTDMTSAP